MKRKLLLKRAAFAFTIVLVLAVAQPLGDLIAAYQNAVRSNEWLPIE